MIEKRTHEKITNKFLDKNRVDDSGTRAQKKPRALSARGFLLRQRPARCLRRHAFDFLGKPGNLTGRGRTQRDAFLSAAHHGRRGSAKSGLGFGFVSGHDRFFDLANTGAHGAETPGVDLGLTGGATDPLLR